MAQDNKDQKNVQKPVNQNQQPNVNKSVDSQNPQERRFQPTTDQNNPVRGVAGNDEAKIDQRKAELDEQAPNVRLHTGADEKAEQPEGAKTADSVNPVEANSLAAHVQPTATKKERDAAEREFNKANKEEQVKGGPIDLRTATTAEKDALSSRTGQEPAAAAREVKESVSTDLKQDSNKGSRKFL